jgi:hypothetical protein
MPVQFDDPEGVIPPPPPRGVIPPPPPPPPPVAPSIAEPASEAPAREESAGDFIRQQLQELNAALLEENARMRKQCADYHKKNAALLEENAHMRSQLAEVHGDVSCGPSCKTADISTDAGTISSSNNAMVSTTSNTTTSSTDNTTLIVRHPRHPRRNDPTPEMFMSDLEILGFAGQYDYLYSPRDRKGSKGYAFINMIDRVYAQRFFDCVEMLKEGEMESLPLKWLDKTSSVQEACIQGRDPNLRHFWSICRGMWPVHDNVPYVLIDGKMVQTLPWLFLDEGQPNEVNTDTPQTLCLRGIPSRIGPVEMMEILDKSGFDGSYSYFFMPCDVRTLTHRSYAFVHLDTKEKARLFIDQMNGYVFEGADLNSEKTLRVSLAKQQGIVANLEKSKTLSYSGSLLYYPWVRIDGQMACVSTEDQLRGYLKDLKSRGGEDAQSTFSTEDSICSCDDC